MSPIVQESQKEEEHERFKSLGSNRSIKTYKTTPPSYHDPLNDNLPIETITKKIMGSKHSFSKSNRFKTLKPSNQSHHTKVTRQSKKPKLDDDDGDDGGDDSFHSSSSSSTFRSQRMKPYKFRGKFEKPIGME